MLNILWLVVLALFVLWIVGLGVHWAAGAVWTLFIVGIVLLAIAIVFTLFKDALGLMFGGRRPTTTL